MYDKYDCFSSNPSKLDIPFNALVYNGFDSTTTSNGFKILSAKLLTIENESLAFSHLSFTVKIWVIRGSLSATDTVLIKWTPIVLLLRNSFKKHATYSLSRLNKCLLKVVSRSLNAVFVSVSLQKHDKNSSNEAKKKAWLYLNCVSGWVVTLAMIVHSSFSNLSKWSLCSGWAMLCVDRSVSYTHLTLPTIRLV